MATNNTPYTFDHLEKTITITKDFAAKSSVFGSKAYKTLIGLMKDFPDYTLEYRSVKNSAKIKRSHPSYEKMLDYIRKNESPEKLSSTVNTFNEIKANASKSGSAYKSVLVWFNTNYPSYSGANWNEGNEGGESDD